MADYSAIASDESDSEEQLPSIVLRGMSLNSKHLLNLLQRRRDHPLTSSEHISSADMTSQHADSNRLVQEREEELCREEEREAMIRQEYANAIETESMSSSESSYADSGSGIDEADGAIVCVVDDGLPWDDRFCRCEAHGSMEQNCIHAIHESCRRRSQPNQIWTERDEAEYQIQQEEQHQDELLDDFNDDLGKTMKNLANEATRNRTKSYARLRRAFQQVVDSGDSEPEQGCICHTTAFGRYTDMVDCTCDCFGEAGLLL